MYFVITDTLLVLNSLRLIANGMYTLDNRRSVLLFDYAGQGLAGDDYVRNGYTRDNYAGEDSNENGYSFASWRLVCSSLGCKCLRIMFCELLYVAVNWSSISNDSVVIE